MTMKAYIRAAEAQRKPLQSAKKGMPDLEELVRLATLAASSHNTQPWRFVLNKDRILIHPDLDRRCPVVDPDDAHLWRSLGCATENIVLGASLQGLSATAQLSDGAVQIALSPGGDMAPDPLAYVIPERQCCKAPYDGEPLSEHDLQLLRDAAGVAGARAVLVTAGGKLATMADLIAEGNQVQLSDSAFRNELIGWIRFSDREAIATGDGLAGRVLGMPSVPRWLGHIMVSLALSGSRQAKNDRNLLQSSSAVAVIVAAGDGPEAWVAAGRASQRLQLQATARGIASAFLNQPIETVDLRPKLESLLDLAPEESAHLLLRLGRGARRPYSLRRSLEEVLDRGTDETAN